MALTAGQIAQGRWVRDDGPRPGSDSPDLAGATEEGRESVPSFF